MTFERLLGRKRRGARTSTRIAGGLAGAATGVGLMYFLDPRVGARRRSQLARRAERVLHDVEGTVGAGARDLSHRARGLAHEARARVERERVPDDVLAERVRAKLGRLTAHPRAIEVTVRDGRVELSGPVFRAEHDQVVRGIRWVRGVDGVDDRLLPHDSAEGVRALQGAGPMASRLTSPLPTSFGPGLKLLAGAAGALLALRALLGSGFGRILAGVAGAAILGKSLGESGPASREARRLAREASDSARRSGEERSERAEHRGAWHPAPEVREVKSPAELSPGIASATPEPTTPGRVDRGERGGPNGGRREWKSGGEEGAASVGSDDVAPHASYVAPSAGAGVRESDLGSTAPREADEPEPGSERTSDQGGTPAARRDPSSDGG